jgi:polyisoprenoid-binding protein YceI
VIDGVLTGDVRRVDTPGADTPRAEAPRIGGNGHHERRIRVCGTVLGRDGWPLEPATVTLVGPAGAQLGRAVVGGDGRFEVLVPTAGAATMIVASPGALPVARSVTIPSEGLDLGVVTLARPGDTGTPRPGRWTIDPAHSTIAVTAQHLALSKVHGRFREFSGELVIADPLAQSRCEARIVAGSIDTGNEQRDAHLRSEDFLDAERCPEIRYRSTAVESAGPARWTVHGRLDLAGTTRDVPLDVRYRGTRPDPWGGVRAGFTATARLNREDFRMNWNQAVELGLSLVGTHLLVELDIQAVLAG